MNERGQAIVDFSQVISERYTSLTKSEKRIATYLNKNQEECAFLSAAELAERLKLSEATVVRFARSLDFSSYPLLRSTLQQSFRNRMTHSTRLRGRLEDLRTSEDVFERVTASEIDYLTQALHSIDRAALQQAVELLNQHSRIFVFGLGPSVSLVDLLEIRLTRFGRQVVPLRTTGQEMLEPLLLMNAADLLIAIGFFNMTPNLQLVLEQAALKHTPVILITDTLGPLVGGKADVILAAQRGPVSKFHSLVVPMTVINTLLLALAQEDQDQVLENLDHLDQLRGRLRQANISFP
jgi:DNA-binding MurR/RpiR family transcriptional regulator